MSSVSASNNNNIANANIAQQVSANFNPSWMQQTMPTTPRPPLLNQQKPLAETEEIQACDPIFARYSYGREDLLAMMGRDDVKPPCGIEKCPFFMGTSQTPVVLLSFTETEMRLQQNINSSKAVSAFNRTQGHNYDINSVSETVSGRSGSNASTFAHSRKHQPQNATDSKHTISNRWSALNFTATGQPVRQQAWKNVPNGGGAGNPGCFERASFREKAGSVTQFSDVTGVKKQLEQRMTNQRFNDKPSTESDDAMSSNEQKDNLSMKQPVLTPTKLASGQFPVTEDSETCVDKGVGAVSQVKQNEPNITVEVNPDKWSYLDPNGVQRGPFDSQQMQAWFTSGYFTSSLQVCKIGDANFKKLGDLFHINGESTPFISKQTQVHSNSMHNSQKSLQLQRISPSDLLSAAAASTAHSSTAPGPTLGFADVERIWATTPLEDAGVAISSDSQTRGNLFNTGSSGIDPTKASIPPNSLTHQAFSQNIRDYEMEKALKTREAQILEEQKKLRDKEESLRRDEYERAEKERRMLELEADLKRKQEELGRIAQEKQDEFEQRCKQVAEYERKKREELASLEQRLLTEQQRQKMRMEEEEQRRAKERHEMLEREQERQMLEMESKRKEEEALRLRLALQKTKQLEEARQREITALAEAAAKAEQQRIRDELFEQQTSGPPAQHRPVKSAWQTMPVTTKPIQMQISTQQTVVPPLPPASSERERRKWQQVAIPEPTPIPPAINKNPGVSNSISTAYLQQQQNNLKKNKQKSGGTKAANQNQSKQQHAPADKFTQWIITKIKELNVSVDAEVFANFIAQIDSPDEAEDYIIGYLGDSKETKGFHREFLNKRIELRPRVQQPRKDDLSGPAAALDADAAEHAAAKATSAVSAHSKQNVSNPVNSNSSSTSKKKKQKQQKVLDPSTLGFRAVPDSNRVNAGEIDMPQFQPAANKKR